MQIYVENYPAALFLGIYPEEQEQIQNALISLVMEIATPVVKPGQNVELSQTVDYGYVCTVIDKTLVNKKFALIEDVVLILGQVLKDNCKGILKLDISVEKTKFPGNALKGARVKVRHLFI